VTELGLVEASLAECFVGAKAVTLGKPRSTRRTTGETTVTDPSPSICTHLGYFGIAADRYNPAANDHPNALHASTDRLSSPGDAYTTTTYPDNSALSDTHSTRSNAD